MFMVYFIHNFLTNVFRLLLLHLQGDVIITRIQDTNVVSCFAVTPKQLKLL